MKRIAFVLLLLLTASPLWADFATYFYGGDFDPNNPNANGLSNENDALVKGNPYGAATYQNFVVSNLPLGVGGLFTNNLSTVHPSTGYWEIRNGVSEGNGGRLIASGTAPMTQTPTGRSGFGFAEYHDLVGCDASNWPHCTFLNVTLPTGTYWFAVAPNDVPPTAKDYATDRSFNSNTFGLNRVGTEFDNQQFFNSSFFGAIFTNANNKGVFPSFSSGVEGTFIPEPSSLILFGSGLVTAAFAVRAKLVQLAVKEEIMKRTACVLLLFLATTPLWADCNGHYGTCYFYSGDFDPNNPNANALANENDAIVGGNPYGAATYQNFVVGGTVCATARCWNRVFPRFSGGVLTFNCGEGESCNLSGPSDVPEPSSLILFGSGLVTAAFAVRRRWFS
jgi:hypothetical protein